MTIETWRLEFYPTEACHAIGTELEAARHSLRKWQGMTEANLTKHGLRRARHELMPNDPLQSGKALSQIGNRDCALCERHPGNCCGCALYEARGDVFCDRTTPDETVSPWHDTYNPGDTPILRMVKELEAAVDYAEANQ